jgi:hypothetical protein
LSCAGVDMQGLQPSHGCVCHAVDGYHQTLPLAMSNPPATDETTAAVATSTSSEHSYQKRRKNKINICAVRKTYDDDSTEAVVRSPESKPQRPFWEQPSSLADGGSESHRSWPLRGGPTGRTHRTAGFCRVSTRPPQLRAMVGFRPRYLHASEADGRMPAGRLRSVSTASCSRTKDPGGHRRVWPSIGLLFVQIPTGPNPSQRTCLRTAAEVWGNHPTLKSDANIARQHRQEGGERTQTTVSSPGPSPAM